VLKQKIAMNWRFVLIIYFRACILQVNVHLFVADGTHIKKLIHDLTI